jgi:hypothetical protein
VAVEKLIHRKMVEKTMSFVTLHGAERGIELLEASGVHWKEVRGYVENLRGTGKKRFGCSVARLIPVRPTVFTNPASW